MALILSFVTFFPTVGALAILFLVRGNELVWWLWRDSRPLAVTSLVVGMACWAAFATSAWRARAAGL